MAEILLFHHAQGQTRGFLAFADELRAAGHVVHAPDLYDGKTFTDLDEGVGYAQEVGFGTIQERGRLAADGLPNKLVYAGFSLGALPAQMLAQTRPGSKGALLFHAAFPASEFGGSWPPGVPLQIHMMEDDEWAAEDWRRSSGVAALAGTRSFRAKESTCGNARRASARGESSWRGAGPAARRRRYRRPGAREPRPRDPRG